MLQASIFPKLDETSSESSSDDDGVMQGQMLKNHRKICKLITANNTLILKQQASKFGTYKKRKE